MIVTLFSLCMISNAFRMPGCLELGSWLIRCNGCAQAVAILMWVLLFNTVNIIKRNNIRYLIYFNWFFYVVL